jgi:hypothetical protein
MCPKIAEDFRTLPKNAEYFRTFPKNVEDFWRLTKMMLRSDLFGTAAEAYRIRILPSMSSYFLGTELARTRDTGPADITRNPKVAADFPRFLPISAPVTIYHPLL